MDTLVVVTNGNRTARHILAPLLRDYGESVRGIVVVHGDYAGRTGLSSLLAVGKRTALPYLLAKLLYHSVAEAAQFVHSAKGAPHDFERFRTLHVNKLQDPRIHSTLKSWGGSLLVSVSCPQRLRSDILRMFPKGGLNIHSSDLPRYAGLAPYYWVLAQGEVMTGVTVHWLTEEFDDGNIVAQTTVDILPRESAYSLFCRLARIGGPLLTEALARVSKGGDTGEQQDPCRRSYYSHPNLSSYVALRRAGHRVVTFKDLLRACLPAGEPSSTGSAITEPKPN